MTRTILFKLLEGMLLALIGFKVFQMLFRIYSIITVTRLINGNESARPQLSFILDGLQIEHRINYVFIIILLILLSTWVFIKYRNAHRITHLQLTYKPIWAVFSFILPVFNLVAPYRIMSELWLVQNKDMSVDQEGKQLIKSWWILSIIVVIVSWFINILVGKVEGLQEFLKFEYYYLFFFVFILHYLLLTRKLVRLLGA